MVKSSHKTIRRKIAEQNRTQEVVAEVLDILRSAWLDTVTKRRQQNKQNAGGTAHKQKTAGEIPGCSFRFNYHKDTEPSPVLSFCAV